MRGGCWEGINYTTSQNFGGCDSINCQLYKNLKSPGRWASEHLPRLDTYSKESKSAEHRYVHLHAYSSATHDRRRTRESTLCLSRRGFKIYKTRRNAGGQKIKQPRGTITALCNGSSPRLWSAHNCIGRANEMAPPWFLQMAYSLHGFLPLNNYQ